MTPPGLFRNSKKANWSYFKSLLTQKHWENPPKFWSKETIEEEAEKLLKDIIQALDKICPEKEQVIKPKPPSWWTTELHNLKRKVKNAWNDWKNLSSNPEAEQENILNKYDAYKSIKKNISKVLKSQSLVPGRISLQNVMIYTN